MAQSPPQGTYWHGPKAGSVQSCRTTKIVRAGVTPLQARLCFHDLMIIFIKKKDTWAPTREEQKLISIVLSQGNLLGLIHQNDGECNRNVSRLAKETLTKFNLHRNVQSTNSIWRGRGAAQILYTFVSIRWKKM